MSHVSLPSVLDSSLYIPELKNRRKDSVIAEVVARAHACGVIRHEGILRDLLLLYERFASSGIGKGVAVPHARSLAVVEPRVVVARSARGIEWDSQDAIPVTLVFLALSPSEVSEAAHHRLLSGVIGVARYQRNRTRLMEATTFETVSTLLREVTL